MAQVGDSGGYQGGSRCLCSLIAPGDESGTEDRVVSAEHGGGKPRFEDCRECAVKTAGESPVGLDPQVMDVGENDVKLSKRFRFGSVIKSPDQGWWISRIQGRLNTPDGEIQLVVV